nr:OTU domain-containing protein DDB_G0284757-like [Pocillopora verrucosa]
MKLMTSGDIELNPGPELHVNVNTETTVSVGSTILLNFRLCQLGLRPLDVGGAGDCFFRAVSHQLYGDPCHHLHVRQTGSDYLRANPERFIESNTQNSWNEYLTNMSLQGTWCDALIVQAVAESHYLRIHIIESHENFGHTTIVQPVQLLEEPVTSIYLGHVSEVHYVSTVPCMFGSSSSESQQSHSDLNMIEESVVSWNSHISTSKRKRSSYMREYRKRKKVDERRNLPS